jgi:hypothetical protein
LKLVHQDETNVVDELGIADQEGVKLFINDDGDVKPAALDALVVFPAIVGGDDSLAAGLFVVFVKLLEFFFRQGLGGDEVEDPFALAAVMEGEDLADEGLTGGGDGGEEKVAAVEDLYSLKARSWMGRSVSPYFCFRIAMTFVSNPKASSRSMRMSRCVPPLNTSMFL